MAAGLRGGGLSPGLLARVRGDGIDPARRVNLHRNHVRVTLGEALALHFPVVRRLVGDRAFAAIATRFAAAAPPADPVLALYGAGLPAFLEGEAALAAVPYVAAVAQFEWARHHASIMPGQAAVAASDLAALPAAEELVLRLQPSASLIDSAWAVDRLWEANQPDRDGTPDGPVERRCRLVVWRDAGGAIRAAALDAGEFAFLRAMAAAARLGDAVDAGLAAQPDADLAHLIAAVLGRGLLCRAEL